MAVATNGRRRRKEMEAAKEDAKEQQVAENVYCRGSRRGQPQMLTNYKKMLWKKRKPKSRFTKHEKSRR
jgi:hypothetical protein